jgi:hypothetical protein
MGDFYRFNLRCTALAVDLYDNLFELFSSPCAQNDLCPLLSQQFSRRFIPFVAGSVMTMTLFSTFSVAILLV